MSNITTASNELLQFSQDQINLIKSQIAKDCTNDELALFLYQCKRTGLDPLTRQIYAIKRSGRMTIQTSIDGFRTIAERSGVYAGQDEPVFTYKEDGKTILKCSVTVYKFAPNGQRYPAGVGVAFFSEYYPNPMNLQKTMPHTMIAKVAEALALRKAFPQDLSGLYTNDEMHQANTNAMPLMDKTHPKYKQALDRIYKATATMEDVEQHFELAEEANAEMYSAQIFAIKGLCDTAKLDDDTRNNYVAQFANGERAAKDIVNEIKTKYDIQYINSL